MSSVRRRSAKTNSTTIANNDDNDDSIEDLHNDPFDPSLEITIVAQSIGQPSTESTEPQTFKCVMIGDNTVGKTSLLDSYTGFQRREGNASLFMYSDEQPIRLEFFDTNGAEVFNCIRPLMYPRTDVFLLCFSTVDRSSFDNISTKWYPEVTYHCPAARVVIVGTKVDVRDDPKALKRLEETKKRGKNRSPVSKEEGEGKAKEIKALCYVECSAHTQRGLSEVFERIPNYILKPQQNHKKTKCNLL